MKLYLSICLLLICFHLASGQENGSPKTEGSESLTLETIDSRRQAVVDNTTINETTQKRILDLYRQATENLKRSQSQKTKTTEYETRSSSAKRRANSAKQEVPSTQSEIVSTKLQLQRLQTKLNRPSYVPIEEIGVLEQNKTEIQNELNKIKEELTQLEAGPTIRSNRRKEIRTRSAKIETELANVNQQLAVAAPSDEDSALTLARRTDLLARKQFLTMEAPALVAEQKAYDAEDAVDLLQYERDLKYQQVALTEIKLQIAGLLLDRKSEIWNREQFQLAKQDLEKYANNRFLQPLAERNYHLADQNQKVASTLGDKEKLLTSVNKAFEDLKNQFDTTKRKVDSVGLSSAVGVLLRKQRSELPNVDDYRQSLRARESDIETVQLVLFDLDEERNLLTSINEFLQSYLDTDQVQQIDQTTINKFKEIALELLERRQGILDALRRNQDRYFDALTDLSIAEKQLIQKSEFFADYIDERVLWIRSDSSLLSAWTSSENRTAAREDISSSIRRTFSLSNWQAATGEFITDMKSNALIYIVFAILFAGWIRASQIAKRQIFSVGERVKRGNFNRFVPTVETAILTVFISLPWPILLTFISWRFGQINSNNPLTVGLSTGLSQTAIAVLTIELMKQLCRVNGLADAHFGWPEKSVASFKNYLRWLIRIGAPIILAVLLAHNEEVAPGKNTLERILFIAGCLVVTFFIAITLNPRFEILREHMTLHPETWTFRLRHIWYSASVFAPFAVGSLATFGYYYTAQQLAWRMFWTFVVFAILIVLRAMIRRLLLVHRRKLSIQSAAKRSSAETVSNDLPVEKPSAQSTIADIRKQAGQTTKLIDVLIFSVMIFGIWLNWNDVVPALGFLERWPLWHSTSQVTQFSLDETGSIQSETTETIVPVTIDDLAFALVMIAIALIAARNLPGLLEISVLQKLPFDASIRYAITTLCSYGLTLLGLIIACSVIGLHWSQIQWMATALTFGLAFGLQEMFANFVAGIIILFERPIRVGDIVTLEDITGTVSRVRIRATTITSTERKDYIVPNKDFITGRVLNWTLSDQVNRLEINVGVAYGSDVAQAKNILLNVAREHPMVVDEPAPFAIFEQFADSSLLLVLRCFISMKDIQHRLKIIDELHCSIDELYRISKIEIAFPQQDIHIRTVHSESPDITKSS